MAKKMQMPVKDVDPVEQKAALVERPNLMLAGASSAMAATAIGRISYLYPDGHALILDSQTEYKVASGVDTSKHGAAEFVRLTLDAKNEVTAIGPGPAAQAGYWVGRTERDS